MPNPPRRRACRQVVVAEERDELSRLVDRELALLRVGDDLERSDIARVKRLSEPSGIRKNLIPSAQRSEQSGDAGAADAGAYHQRPVQDPQATRAARCLLYTSPSPRDRTRSRMPSSA